MANGDLVYCDANTEEEVRKAHKNPFAILFDRRYFLFVPTLFALPLLLFAVPTKKLSPLNP